MLIEWVYDFKYTIDEKCDLYFMYSLNIETYLWICVPLNRPAEYTLEESEWPSLQNRTKSTEIQREMP